MFARACTLLPVTLLLACGGKQEMGDGTGAVTLTGDDLDEFGDVASALWLEVTGVTEIWLLESDGQIYDQGPGLIDSLHISTAPDTCDGVVAKFAQEGAASATLLDVLDARNAGDSTGWTDHCGDVDDFLGVLESTQGDLEAYNSLTGAPVGEPSSLPYEGTQAWDGSLLWVPEPGRPWDHWDAANCALEPQSDSGTQALVQGALLSVDAVEDTTVTGSVSGDVEDLGGSNLGTIEANFDAARCEIAAPADYVFVAL